MFFHLKNKQDDCSCPCVHYADNLIWFNLEIGQVSLSLSSTDYDKLVELLRRAGATKNYIDASPSDICLMALEEEEDGHRNLCIFGDELTIVFNLKIDIILGLGEFLGRVKN